MNNTYLFTQEYVSKGHPDKVIDIITNALLDEYLKQDPDTKAGIEGMCQSGIIIIGGEVKSKAKIDVEAIVRQTIIEIGYDKDEYGFNGNTVKVINNITEQSPEINKMVVANGDDIASGDQGMGYGQASIESPDYLSLAYYLAREFGRELKTSNVSYLRPDAKTQVTVEYDEKDKPVRIHTVLISTSHDPIDLEQLRVDVLNNVVEKVIRTLPQSIQKLFDQNTLFRVNPNGAFTICGPASDCGVSGRKLCVDSGYPIVGGGNMNGKDGNSKNDVYAPHFARYIAKNMVGANIADEVVIQIAYVIGDVNPTSIYVKTKNNHTNLSDIEISNKIKKLFSFKPKDISAKLRLKEPIYKQTGFDCHFGRENYTYNGSEYFAWEKMDSVDLLIDAFQDNISKPITITQTKNPTLLWEYTKTTLEQQNG